MNAVRDCPDAQWFPSRYHFALLRLMALVRGHFPTRPRTDVDHILLAIDSDQTALEQYLVSIWLLVTAACYVGALLPLRWSVAALPLAALAIQLTITVLGVIGSGNHLRRNAIVLFGMMTIASAYFVTGASPARYMAGLFLGVLALNFLSWLTLLALREAVRRREQRCAT
ncbi:MAG TPA: hypothetical protein VER58_14980 [Thermoanaerobaculia bacterium]|nr:hypothetical protein [Thermoanaerobaculia bacterium]